MSRLEVSRGDPPRPNLQHVSTAALPMWAANLRTAAQSELLSGSHGSAMAQMAFAISIETEYRRRSAGRVAA